MDAACGEWEEDRKKDGWSSRLMRLSTNILPIGALTIFCRHALVEGEIETGITVYLMHGRARNLLMRMAETRCSDDALPRNLPPPYLAIHHRHVHKTRYPAKQSSIRDTQICNNYGEISESVI